VSRLYHRGLKISYSKGIEYLSGGGSECGFMNPDLGLFFVIQEEHVSHSLEGKINNKGEAIYGEDDRPRSFGRADREFARESVEVLFVRREVESEQPCA